MRIIAFLCFLNSFIVAMAGSNNTASTEPVLKQYYFVLLTKGPNRTQDSATVQKIQKAHLENIGRLADEGKLIVAGPFADDTNWRGIFIFDLATKDEVEKALQTDLAISSGRLAYEIHPWLTKPGTVIK